MHAAEFLKHPEKHAAAPVVAIFGKERFLKQAALHALFGAVLGTGDEAAEPTRFAGGPEIPNGPVLALRVVTDELRTVSMWGGRRLVVVEDAEAFVSEHRAALEKYVERPTKNGVLGLDVKTWASTTRLAKAVARVGLSIECGELKGQPLVRWLEDAARERHGARLDRDAAEMLVQFVGEGLGLLDSELEKLATYVGEKKSIGVADVQAVSGGWKAEDTFKMMAAVMDGDAATALEHLGKLYEAKQAPEMTLGGIAYKLRPLARVVALTARGVETGAAIRQAGVYRDDFDRSRNYLRRIGRRRAQKLLDLLLTADGGLKGESRTHERLILERLLVELSGRG